MASTSGIRDDRDRRAALLVVDMINPLDFEGADALKPHAVAAARQIAALARRARAAALPVIYVNDNFMHWQADFREIVAQVREGKGRELAELLAPEPGDYFVLKPKHSAFLATPLEILLEKLEVGTVLVSGVATDGCILATATDAHMREYGVHVPGDCVAAITAGRSRRALELMHDAMHIDVRGAHAALAGHG
ncbi:cysteine hydrolase [Lysobacter sp. GX 14042]|uniref:cysteine hydrolase family protein n=1 Tax=Lysobacter sp. GX 14042 TaxID=2907155 RepID=UPI001F42F6D5|nr:isochorismatase family cysteine hydrolase [Lysobacter sp. GX 14042]MCE7031303.1 cysteine hydrolase [Lysobacter sp. GX 14042]